MKKQNLEVVVDFLSSFQDGAINCLRLLHRFPSWKYYHTKEENFAEQAKRIPAKRAVARIAGNVLGYCIAGPIEGQL